tara:strand:+ start:2959 stop:3354 length:396 start_codon:yes stop_codon:yes gene_type:complete
MMGIGFPELMVILIIIMIIFGAGKLPEIGSAFGRSIKNFKTSMKEAEEVEPAASADGEIQAAAEEPGQLEEGEQLSKEEQERIAREKLQAELDERDRQRDSAAAQFTASLPKSGSYDYAKEQEEKAKKKKV